jgi:hypothetical protein
LRFHHHSGPDLIAAGNELMKTGFAVRLSFPNRSEIILMYQLPAGHN